MEACLTRHFVSRALRKLGHEPRIIPAIYVMPFVKVQKNDYNDAEAIAEAALRPYLVRCVRRVRSSSTCKPAIGCASSWCRAGRRRSIRSEPSSLSRALPFGAGVTALRISLFDILKNREDEISPRK